jgi:hypothetical protein
LVSESLSPGICVIGGNIFDSLVRFIRAFVSLSLPLLFRFDPFVEKTHDKVIMQTCLSLIRHSASFLNIHRNLPEEKKSLKSTFILFLEETVNCIASFLPFFLFPFHHLLIRCFPLLTHTIS